VVRQWARKGTRPRQPADQRYENAYLFGAICPARGKGAALALPYADTEMMQLHLDEIATHVAPGAHGVFETYDDILNAACEAWNNLTARPETIRSIGTRPWAHISQ
jgi:hypothetical protein